MSLEAYFTGDTPRVEGSSIVFQVEANKPASLRCRLIGGSATVECKSVVLPTPYRICQVIWPNTDNNKRAWLRAGWLLVPSGSWFSGHLYRVLMLHS